MNSGISLLVFPSEHVHLLEIFGAIPKISSASGDYYLTGRGKDTHSLGAYVKKSSNTQKHRELQLTVFLGFQAACVLSGIF